MTPTELSVFSQKQRHPITKIHQSCTAYCRPYIPGLVQGMLGALIGDDWSWKAIFFFELRFAWFTVSYILHQVIRGICHVVKAVNRGFPFGCSNRILAIDHPVALLKNAIMKLHSSQWSVQIARHDEASGWSVSRVSAPLSINRANIELRETRPKVERDESILIFLSCLPRVHVEEPNTRRVETVGSNGLGWNDEVREKPF